MERLIRYCARPPFASENLKWNHELLVYQLTKPTEGLQFIQLLVLEFFDRVAALIPPPRSHLHHYHGVFAPNAPFRKRIVAQAGKFLKEHTPSSITQVEKSELKKSSYSWAKLLARIYDVFPLVCSCGETMKIIALITNPLPCTTHSSSP